MSREIDGKFSTDGGRIYNTQSNESIPEDEPLFLLRARDQTAVDALLYYYRVCKTKGCCDAHLKALDDTIQAFVSFKTHRPERMKLPGSSLEKKATKV